MHDRHLRKPFRTRDQKIQRRIKNSYTKWHFGKSRILLFDHIFPRIFSPFRIKATKQAGRSIFNETMATANNSACGNLLNDLTFRRYSQTFKKYVESILEKLTNLIIIIEYYRLSHDVVTLGCKSRRFDCVLLVFIRR